MSNSNTQLDVINYQNQTWAFIRLLLCPLCSSPDGCELKCGHLFPSHECGRRCRTAVTPRKRSGSRRGTRRRRDPARGRRHLCQRHRLITSPSPSLYLHFAGHGLAGTVDVPCSLDRPSQKNQPMVPCQAEGQARGPLRGIAREARRAVLAQHPPGRD
jgi:hypothetical protein